MDTFSETQDLSFSGWFLMAGLEKSQSRKLVMFVCETVCADFSEATVD